MKTLLFAFIFAGSTALAVNAQDVATKDVPSTVAAALTQKFANATDLDWEMNGTNYEADFDVNRVDHNVLIDPSGKILMTKRDIQKKDLPQAVSSAISQNHKGLRLDDMEVLEIDGTTYYQVELDDKAGDKKLVFTADGKEASNITYWD
ncbi:PepSY-like domain-containing protein [Pontibacter pudoricolor]|uniref:PepSY-like domain-containing protein n=1 Tax=Pontibacter pudoricolor TaxID=2694930 RepID=UPI0013907094|nr:PepSY-like domain-containing protein [Pontibacter pudoricolor]